MRWADINYSLVSENRSSCPAHWRLRSMIIHLENFSLTPNLARLKFRLTQLYANLTSMALKPIWGWHINFINFTQRYQSRLTHQNDADMSVFDKCQHMAIYCASLITAWSMRLCHAMGWHPDFCPERDFRYLLTRIRGSKMDVHSLVFWQAHFPLSVGLFLRHSDVS